MVIHEALHRTLSEPMNQDEQTVEHITSILTQYNPATVSQELSRYFLSVKSKKIPWLVAFGEIYPEYPKWGESSNPGGSSQSVLKPLLDDGTLLLSTDPNTRIKIILSVYNGINEVTIIDRYRNLKYTYVFDGPRLGFFAGFSPNAAEKYYANKNATMTEFIRKTLAQIREDLKL